MSLLEPGGIDCDIHPAVPNLKALHPYLSDHWRDVVVQRGVHELESIAYPANSPLTSRPDWRLPNGKPGSDLDALRAHALTPFGTSHRHLQLPVRRAAAVLRGHGRRLRPRGERLDGRRVAGQGAAPARLHRGADAEPRDGGGRDQPRRRRTSASCRSCCW